MRLYKTRVRQIPERLQFYRYRTTMLRPESTRQDLIIALEASWELDPVLMENNLWKRIEEEPEQKAYTVKSDEKKKA